jgi:hypothetical protein
MGVTLAQSENGFKRDRLETQVWNDFREKLGVKTDQNAKLFEFMLYFHAPVT